MDEPRPTRESASVLSQVRAVASNSAPSLRDSAGTDDQHLDRRIIRVPLTSIHAADSPRSAGEDGDHIRVLAELCVPLPPILVHRDTMRIIDGMHRFRAAALRGDSDIEVRFFDGEEEDAFVLAVRSNVTHGLPLSRSDRARAALRILASHPNWSDRMIAGAAGVSPKTVGAIRERSSVEIPQLAARVGVDGRTRRVRRFDVEQSGPPSSDKPIARTQRRSARKLAVRTGGPIRGLDFQPPDRRDATSPTRQEPPAKEQRPGPDSLVSALRKDPSLRFSDSGRALLRLLDARDACPYDLDQLVDMVPRHWAGRVADLAHVYSVAWQAFATRLAQSRSEVWR